MDDKFYEDLTTESEIDFVTHISYRNKIQLIKALQYSKACNSDIDVEVMDYYINLLNDPLATSKKRLVQLLRRKI